MRLRRFLLLLASWVAGPVAANAQEDSSLEFVPLTEHLYRITEHSDYTVNLVASVGPDGVLLVDTGFKDLAVRLRAALDSLGSGKVEVVINTHSHSDHVGGNATFGDAMIVAQETLRPRLQRGTLLLEEYPDAALPDLVFVDELTLFFNGEEVRVYWLPGSHMIDDVIVLFTESKVAYMGDIAYGMNFPSVGLRKGNAARYGEVVARALELLPEDVTVISGHGEDISYAQLQEYQRMAATTASIVARELAAGATLTDMQDREILREWDSFGGHYVSTSGWIGLLVMGLEGPPLLSLVDSLYHAYYDDRPDAAAATYTRLKRDQPNDFLFIGAELSYFAAYLLNKDDVSTALTLYELLVTDHPDEPYFHLAYGDAWSLAGNDDRAIASYRRALALNPSFQAAEVKLRELGVEPE